MISIKRIPCEIMNWLTDIKRVRRSLPALAASHERGERRDFVRQPGYWFCSIRSRAEISNQRGNQRAITVTNAGRKVDVHGNFS